MKGTKTISVKHIRAIALVVLAVILFSVAILLFRDWEKKQGLFPEQSGVVDDELIYNGEEYVLKKDVETFLLIGLDTFSGAENDSGYNNDKLADFLLLLVLDNKASTVSAVQINRDTMVEINRLGVAGDKIGTVNRQIAFAHTYGNGNEVSCRNTADSVSSLLNNVKINHYASVTMDAVSEFNDLLGGISLEVLDDFSGIDDSLKQGETVTLTGKQALTYVRTRYGLEDSSNTRRMERQRQYLNALYDKTRTVSEDDTKFLANAVSGLSKHTVSNCTVHQLQTLLEKVTAYDTLDIHTPEGELIKGDEYMEFHPDQKALEGLAVELFCTKKQ